MEWKIIGCCLSGMMDDETMKEMILSLFFSVACPPRQYIFPLEEGEDMLLVL